MLPLNTPMYPSPRITLQCYLNAIKTQIGQSTP
jgi:hypothetical protein